MYKQNSYTPTQEKYSYFKAPNRHERSQTFTNLHKSSAGKSTQIGSHSHYRSTVTRLQEAKRTIDTVIVDLNDKKDMNDEAFREIRSVNSELAEQFRKNTSIYGKESLSTLAPDYKSPQGSSYDLRVLAPQDDNLGLRGKLNEEIRKNNELMLRVSRLQHQNQCLKQEKQMTFGPTTQKSQVRQLEIENERLKRTISHIAQIPQKFFSQLQELKKQNEKLRTDTVKLLQKVDRVI